MLTRDELEAIADGYVAALVARDPAAVPLAERIIYSENNQRLEPGEGAWRTVSGLGSYRHILADAAMGTVGYLGTVRVQGRPAILDACLTLRDGRIAQVESLLIRDAVGAHRLEAMGGPEDVWLETVPEAERVDKTALAAVAQRYLAGMERNDGHGDYSFFHPSCNRIEHGLQTTNVRTPTAYGHSDDVEFSSLTAEQQWKTGFLGFVTEIRSRRVLVVDEERQAVLLAATLDHDGTIRRIELTTGRTFEIPPYFEVPRTLQVMEAFRVLDGRLYRIEMTLTEVPFGSRPPLEATPGLPSPAAAGPLPHRGSEPVLPPASAAASLTPVLEAMRRHDPSGLPLAPEVRYTENGQKIAVGTGVWRTLTDFTGAGGGASGLEARVVDTGGGQAVWLGRIDELRVPGVLALRLRAIEGELVEIETVVVREEMMNERYGTITLFQPRLLLPLEVARLVDDPPGIRGPAADPGGPAPWLVELVERYLDALERDDSAGVPLDARCWRRENGWWTALDPMAAPFDPAHASFRPFSLGVAELIDAGYFARITRVRERHHVVDESGGRVLTIAACDVEGDVTGFTVAGIGDVCYPGAFREEAPEPSEEGLFASRLEPDMVAASTELIVQMATVRAGRIVGLDVFTRGGPLGMSTGFPT